MSNSRFKLFQQGKTLRPVRFLFLLVAFFSFSSLKSFAQPVTDSKDYKHWANTLGEWINGDLNKNNSSYNEGDVVPHVYIAKAENLQVGGEYTVSFTYNYYKGSSNSGGFTEIKEYNTTIPSSDIDILSGIPVLTNGSFYSVNANITSYSAPLESGTGNELDQTVTVTFNYTGGGDAEIYFGLRLAKPGDVSTPPGTGITKGAGSWPGSSLQTTKNDGDASGNNGKKTLSINPNAFTFDCAFTPEPITGSASICVGSTSQLSSATSGGVWSSSDETVATVDALSGLVTGVAAGSATITYMATNDAGCGGSVTYGVTVTAPVVPTFSTIDPVCEGSTIVLPASSLEGIPGIWSPAIDNTKTTTYTFTPDAGQCATKSSLTVTVTLKTVTSFDPISAICSGGSFTLPATLKEGVPGTWSPAIDKTKTTTYTFTPAAGQCATAATLTVTVNPTPTCDITSTGTPTEAKVGVSVSFSGPTAPAGSTYSYAWTFTANTSGAKFGGTSLTASGKTVTVSTTTTGSYTIALTVTDIAFATNCLKSGCIYTIQVKPIGPSVTYTQGFYGNSGGKACNGDNSYGIMLKALTAAGGSIRFGNQLDGRSFTLRTMDVNAGAKSSIYQMLPGGTTPAVLKLVSGVTTAVFGSAGTYGVVPMTPKITNILLAQTIALRFNLYYSSNLSGLVLTGNVLTFAKPTTACGSAYQLTGTTQTIPCAVWKYLSNTNNYSTASIGNLYDLANKVLGGTVTTITPSDMNTALNVINTGFDAGAQIIAVSVSTGCTATSGRAAYVQIADLNVTQITVSTYPNPYTDRVRFNIVSPVSFKASLDVYNLMGQKVANVYHGTLSAGRVQVVDYNVPTSAKGSLIYTLRVADKQVNGKVIHLK